MNDLINNIIIYHKYQYTEKFNEHWNWFIKLKSSNHYSNFNEYIKFNKKVKEIAKKYFTIYNWLHRRLFINKAIKLVEYYYRPGNAGYYDAYNNFIKHL